MKSLMRILAVCALAASRVAFAGAGDHIQAGPAEIIPSISVGLEAWSNVYLSQGTRVQGIERPEVFGMNFLLSPRLRTKVDHPKVKFAFDGSYSLRKFFQAEVAQDLDRFTDFGLGMRLDAFPRSTVGFYIADDAQLRNQPGDVASYDGTLINQVTNTLTGGIDFRFGPGIRLSPGVAWNYLGVRVPRPNGPEPYNQRNMVSPRLDFEWRFFPATAYIVEARVDFVQWQNNTVDAGGSTLGQTLAIPNSRVYRGITGLRGRLLRFLVLRATIGYGFAEYLPDSVDSQDGGAEAEGFDQNTSAGEGLLANLGMDFDIGHSDARRFGQLIRLDYNRDFVDSFFTNYLSFDRLSGGLRSRWGRWLGTTIDGGVRFERYRGEVNRNDIFVDVGGRVIILPAKWLDVSLGATWFRRASPGNLDQGIRPAPTVEYDNVIGSLNATFTY